MGAGVKIVQLRAKTLTSREFFSVAEKFRELTAKFGALFLVNDRLDIALAVGADGVHLGWEDLPLLRARELAPDLILGYTCKSDFERAVWAVSNGADYVAFGAFFPTETKGDAVPAPLSILRRAKELPVPVVAIGGIGPKNIESVFRAGADSAAVSSAIQGAKEPKRAAEELLQKSSATLRKGRAESDEPILKMLNGK